MSKSTSSSGRKKNVNGAGGGIDALLTAHGKVLKSGEEGMFYGVNKPEI